MGLFLFVEKRGGPWQPVGKGERRWQEVFNSAIQARVGLDGRSAWAAPGCAELLSIASDRNKNCHLLHLPTPPHPTPPTQPPFCACLLQCLKEEDRCLPFITGMLPILQAGIAVHHSGGWPCPFSLHSVGFAWSCTVESEGAEGHTDRRRLQGTARPQNNDLVLKSVSTSFFSTSFLPAGLLPILKELVEVLFQEQLVKVGDSVGWCLLVLAW